MTRYQLAEPIAPEIATELSEHHPLIQQLLVNRGITTSAAAKSWLTPAYDAALNDPFLLNDMAVAVERVMQAIAKNEPVVIYSDYDCDGIPGAVVLHDFFTEIGFTNFSVYIPHRHHEGFGFNADAAKTLAKEGAKLIITIDCGIGDRDAVAEANKAGVDIIITDHHQAKADLPEAVAIVNPAISPDYPFPYLCGAGVVFKLVQALLTKDDFAVAPGREKWWLDMVGLATVADMVSLTDENRTLAHYGLTVLRKSRRPGLQALLKAQRASQRHLSEDDIGFTIGPRINAASRMGEPERAFKLLTATTEADAIDHLEHLEQLNNERKGQVAAMTRAAHKKLQQQSDIPLVIVLGDPDWRPSLVGLVANKLSEEHRVPAFIWGRDGNGVIKGSCRSDGAVSLVRLMETATEQFLEYGGHHASGGFSVSDTQIHTLPTALVEAYQAHSDEVLVDEPVVIDAHITTADLSRETVESLLALGPFGVGNPKPLLQLSDVTLKGVDAFGKGKEHTKLLVPTLTGTMEAVAFFKTPEQFSHTPATNEPVSLLVHPEQSFFMGRMQTRLRLVDVLSASII
ncbi:single-stranded-DNA-specific exonuclease RecJ [bacterium]|nr:single-stranded-DNA-specific exonuclease RecJ [bacterium]|tara:strand:+ start:6259 stop:7971 length:1713 start_codon:yes stop_codon:yes gene_type:complete